MFGLSGEHLLIILVVLLIFGPKRLPDLGNSLGRTLKNFKDAMNGKGEEAPPAAEAPQQLAHRAPAPASAEASVASQPVAEPQIAEPKHS